LRANIFTNILTKDLCIDILSLDPGQFLKNAEALKGLLLKKFKWGTVSITYVHMKLNYLVLLLPNRKINMFWAPTEKALGITMLSASSFSA